MIEEHPYSPGRVADRLEIQDVILKWSRAVDRRDAEEIRNVFHADGTDRHGPYSGGVDGLVAWVTERHRNIPFSSHQVSNILIEFAGPNTALVETYVRTIQTYPFSARESLLPLLGPGQQVPSGGADYFTSSRYIDRFERRDGRWKIQERVLVNDWTRVVGLDAGTTAAETEKKGPLRGRRDRADMLFVQRAKVGL